MAIHSRSGRNMNLLSGSELMALRRAAQLISKLHDELKSEGFTEPMMYATVLGAAVPDLIERAFTTYDD